MSNKVFGFGYNVPPTLTVYRVISTGPNGMHTKTVWKCPVCDGGTYHNPGEGLYCPKCQVTYRGEAATCLSCGLDSDYKGDHMHCTWCGKNFDIELVKQVYIDQLENETVGVL